MARRFSAIIQGKVQAVHYRASAQEQAIKLQLQGFVTNLPDGHVKLEAQGSMQNLNHFLHWCQYGPPRARVDKIFVTWLHPTQNSENGFNILGAQALTMQ